MTNLDRAVQAYQAKDFATARKLCTELAEQGQGQARYMLGTMYSFGEGGPSDPAEAARHYRIAAEAGHAVAAYSLGALYALGRGVPQDYAEAMRWYRRAADGGSADALFKVGVMYANGEGVPKDLTEAGQWWRQAADKGYAPAMLFLGHLHQRGDTGAADPVAAAEWYLKAWQAGNKEAAPCLIKLVPALEQAGDGGSPAAQHALGVIHKFGYQNHGAAARRLAQAAEQNHPEALRLLAFSYERGEGVENDEARAAALYQRAAELGDKFAQFNLAAFYASGRGGLEKNIDLAIRWYRRAANRGMFEAQWPLAELLALRNRDRRDANEAIQRMFTVAAAGPAEAEYRLVAGNGEWVVSMKERGTIAAMAPITMDELQGLPDDYEPPP
jgi:TPR repeat protein